MANETLLIVSLALCFGMVVVAAKVGFSAAFGAFIMGSILAETVEAENIEKLVAPVKDLFGAIFFVSVGIIQPPRRNVKADLRKEYCLFAASIPLLVNIVQPTGRSF